MKKWDYLLLGGLLFVSAVFFVLFRMHRPEGGSVTVRVGREERAVYSLYENRTVEIEGAHGGSNTLVIEQGKAHLSAATCPDKLCVHQGEISRQGQSIICLPNEVIIEVHQEDTKEEEELFDAVVK